MPITRRLERWSHVVSAHRPSQLGWRAFFLLQRRLFPLLSKSSYTNVEPMRRAPRPMFDAILERQLQLRQSLGDWAQRVDRLLRGEYCFLNESRQLGLAGRTNVRDVAPVSHLWRFQFHYQESLLDLLAAAGSDADGEAARLIWPSVDGWIRNYPITDRAALPDAWHPFCISRRVPVWLLLWHAGAIPVEGEERFARSLAAQARYLERHLEWDLRGNHLLENLKAVLLAGAFAEGDVARQRVRTMGSLFVQQLGEQLLPSGEHFERSPMYHAQMLSAVLDVRDATREVDPDLSSACGAAAARMATFLASILHPDEQVPLLSDSALGETPQPRRLILAATADSHPASDVDGPTPAPEVADYWTFRDGEDFVLFDRGNVAADELPAHAHNDLLTMEVSLAGRRAIVDSGVYDYATGAMRAYCRSTAAHNVLQVDGDEQCDLWSRFRMGRRGHVRGTATGREGAFRWAAAIHDAYAPRDVPRVGRWMACRPGGPLVVADWAEGAGSHQLDSWFHLHPDAVDVRIVGPSVQLTIGPVQATLTLHTAGQLSLDTGWYCPDFGARIRATVIRGSHFGPLPATMVWSLAWTDDGGVIDVEYSDPGAPQIVWTDGSQRHQWSPRLVI